jgi:hypothetical protein
MHLSTTRAIQKAAANKSHASHYDIVDGAGCCWRLVEPLFCCHCGQSKETECLIGEIKSVVYMYRWIGNVSTRECTLDVKRPCQAAPMTFVHFLQAQLRACDFVELQCHTDRTFDTTSYYLASSPHKTSKRQWTATMAHSKPTSPSPSPLPTPHPLTPQAKETPPSPSSQPTSATS